MLLAPNFDSSEFDVNEPVPPQYSGNVVKCASIDQQFRDMTGSAIVITSCYRDPARNATIPGSVSDSQHITASATDVDFVTVSPQQVARQLLAAETAGTGPGPYSQVIFYTGDHHVHIGIYDPALGKEGEKLVKYNDTGQDNHYEILNDSNINDIPDTLANPSR